MDSLRRFDLNLLVPFDILIAERSVTAASKRMGVGQPAMSNTLSRLRDMFDDPLLVRTPAADGRRRDRSWAWRCARGSLATGGFAVTGLARDPARVAPTEGVALRAADAADPAVLGAAINAGGAVDVLIYNAYRATMTLGGPAGLDPAALVEDFRVNVAGALAAVQAVLPGMRAAGRGSILLTGGGLALDPTGWLAAASLAVGKAGLRSLAQTLHKQLAPEGIHVGTVTIAGQIQPGTAFDPARIADQFWQLHAQPLGHFEWETVFRGMAGRMP